MERNRTYLPRSTRKALQRYRNNMSPANLFRILHRAILCAFAVISGRRGKDLDFFANNVTQGEMNMETGTAINPCQEPQEAREDLKSVPNNQGPKEFAGKLDWFIFPFEEAEQVLEVFSHGAKKYGAPFTYRKLVPHDQLFSATMRHLIELHKGNQIDSESRIRHWAHIAANALMALSHHTNKEKSIIDVLIIGDY